MRIFLSLPLLCATVTAQGLIYSNGPVVTHPGAGPGGSDVSLLEPALNHDIFGFGHSIAANISLAEDFHSCGMAISAIEFYAYQTNSGTTPSINDVRVRILDGDPSTGGSPNVVFGDTTTNRFGSARFSNIYRMAAPIAGNTARPVMKVTVDITNGGVNPPLVLAPGVFWMEWQMGGNAALTGPWCPPIAVVGQLVPGNARQRQGATWVNTFNCISPPAPAPACTVNPTGLPFEFFGVVTGSLASATTYGTGKAGTNGVPLWSVNPNPRPGFDYEFEVTNGLNGVAPVVLVGLGRISFPLPPIGTILVNPLASFTLSRFSGGVASATLPLSGCGGPVDLQAFFLDPGAAGGIAHTNGLELTLGQ
jgi:hypothetical protein